ncbi:putative methyltransferase DDB_G0268948 [Styela clava]
MAYSHFFNGEEITKFYVQHRPSYPSFISEVIMKYIHKQKDNNSENGRLKKMLDVGCGAGQSTHMFASYFESILGIDVSDSQIKHANEHNPNKNVEFRLVRDNFFPVEDESVDLVTCAMAIHWLDLTTFETECYRVLKPRGCCVIYGYCPSFIRKINEPQSKRVSIIEAEKQFLRTIKSSNASFHSFENYDSIFDRLKTDTKERIKGLGVDLEFSLKQYKDLFKTSSKYLEYLKLAFDKEKAPMCELGNSVKRILEMEDIPDQDIKFILTYTYPTMAFTKSTAPAVSQDSG